MKMNLKKHSNILYILIYLTLNNKFMKFMNCEDRIMGGTSVRYIRWPFLVSIQKYDKQEKKSFHFCGGTIWNSKYIISAAHCFVKTNNAKDVNIFVGHEILSQPNKGFRLKIKRIIKHEKYMSPVDGFDIAVMELEEKLDFKSKHKVLKCACKLKSKKKINPDTCFAIGWGRIYSEGPGSDSLRQVLVPIDEACKNNTYDMQIDTNKLVCAGQAGMDSCQGDSGGPLVCQVANIKEKRFVFHGIVSWGVGCGEVGKPGIYTKLSGYTGWVKNVTGC